MKWSTNSGVLDVFPQFYCFPTVLAKTVLAKAKTQPWLLLTTMKGYQDSEEIPDRNQVLYYTLCLCIQRHLGNTANILLD